MRGASHARNRVSLGRTGGEPITAVSRHVLHTDSGALIGNQNSIRKLGLCHGDLVLRAMGSESVKIVHSVSVVKLESTPTKGYNNLLVMGVNRNLLPESCHWRVNANAAIHNHCAG